MLFRLICVDLLVWVGTFVEFFSELSGGGVSKAEIVTGKPHITPAAWTNYSYTVRTGSDVSGE
jgi:hypothetical protein